MLNVSEGTLLGFTEIAASWPNVLSPQHGALPSTRRTQLCASPLAIDTALLSPSTLTGTSGFVVLLPSCPLLFAPQHRAVPSATSAQVWKAPVAIETAFPSPCTITGRDRVTVVLSP